jgi:acetylornithine/succinyldiaminopimelate/putrescine aminotransferase
MKPDLIKTNEIQNLDINSIKKIYLENINPGQVYYFNLLGFGDTHISSSDGVYYFDQKGQKILDFAGGVGSLALGHNHPRILAVRKKFNDELRHEIGMNFYSQYVAALSNNLASICPGDLNFVILGNTGSEVMEQAIKMVEKYQGQDRSKIIFANNSFHGRTKGALSLTDSKSLRSSFRLVDGDIKVEFGDAQALKEILSSRKDIGGIVLEAIQGGAGIIIPPAGYLKAVRDLCDEYDVLLIADEIQCGFGRTGKLFAFEFDNIIPDIVAISKSLGGGKAAVSAAIVREPIYRKAYKDRKDWFLQMPSTFGGMGEACVTANEAINILYDENLIEKVAEKGLYFLDELKTLQKKFPNLIKEVRGRGFMIGIEYQNLSDTIKPPLSFMVAAMDDKLKGSVTGFIGAILLNKYQILAGFTEYNRNVMRLHVPLITEIAEINYFVKSLDTVLSKGITGIVTDFIKLKF